MHANRFHHAAISGAVTGRPGAPSGSPRIPPHGYRRPAPAGRAERPPQRPARLSVFTMRSQAEPASSSCFAGIVSRVRRAVPRLALWAGMLVGAAGIAAPASADVLISNINQGTEATRTTQNINGSDFAQSFTTGTNSFGYTVTDIGVWVAPLTATATLSTIGASIWTESSGVPDTKVGDLSSEPPGTERPNMTFTNADGIRVEANTTYFVVLDSDGSGFGAYNIDSFEGDDEDSGGASGWSIGNGSVGRTSTGSDTWAHSDDASIQLTISGTAVSVDVLISNINQGTEATRTTQNINGSDFAQSFTTGTHSGGYTVTDIGVWVAPLTATATLSTIGASIWTESSGVPDSKVGDLSSEPLGTKRPNLTFTNADGIRVEANTTYFVVLDSDASGIGAYNIDSFEGDDEDSGGASGWSIGNGSQGRISTGPDTWAHSDDASIQLTISGTFLLLRAFRFTESLYRVNEDAGTVQPTIEIVDGSGTRAALGENVTLRVATVALSGLDTATPGEDYTARSRAVAIAATATSATFDVPILDDALIEDPQDFEVSLAWEGAAPTIPGTTVTLGQNAAVRIDSEDTGSLEAGAAAYRVSEGSSVDIPLTLSAAVDKPLQFAVGVPSGLLQDATLAVADPATQSVRADGYLLTVTVPAGTSGALSPVRVQGTVDNLVESDESGSLFADRLPGTPEDLTFGARLSAGVQVTVVDVPPNRPPSVANPIPNRTATVDEPFEYTFPSNTFLDPDNTPLTYSASGMPSWLRFAPALRRFTGTPLAGDEGAAHVTVTASDGSLSASDTFRITVVAENSAPTVQNPIPDQKTNKREAFDYAFPADTFRDPDGDPLTYTVSGMPYWLRFSPAERRFTGRPDVGYTSTDVTVTAADGSGARASDTFRITVNDSPFVTNPIPDRTAAVDVAFSHTFPRNTFYDRERDPLTYTVSGMPSWLSFSPGQRRFSGTPLGEDDEGVSDVTVTATDDGGLSASDTFRITVESPGNRPPTVSNPIPDLTVADDVRSWSYNFPANTFHDPDGDRLTYTGTGMPSWMTFTEEERYFYGVPTTDDRGTSTVTVTADDGRGGTVSDVFSITVTSTEDENRPPTVAHPIPNQDATVDEPFDYAFPADTFDDPDGDSLTYTAAGTPSWLSFAASSRRFSGTPGEGETGTSNVTVTADDGRGGTVSDVFSITVTAPPPENRPPTVASPIPDRTVAVDEPFDYAFPADTFDDPDGDSLTYTAAGMPSWLSFAPGARRFTGTPGRHDTGTSTVTVTADDGEGGRASDTFRIRVNRAPVVNNPIPDRTAAVDVPFRFTLPAYTFYDREGDSLTYTASGVPSWLSFAPASRRFTGTPLAGDEGSADVTVTASDGHLSVSDTFRITVEPAGNRAPTVANPIPDLNVADDVRSWSYTFPANTFHDPDGDPLTYTGTGMPSWMTFTEEERRFYGQPTTDDRGTSTVTVTADDGRGGTVSDVFSITVGNSASASVTGSLVTLSWDRALDGFAPPNASDFAVRADGEPVAVTATAVSGNDALLALASPVQPGQAVLVDYLGSAMHPLAEHDGTEIAPWRDLPATNTSDGDAGLAVAVFAPLVREPPAWLLREGAPLPAGLAELSLAGAGLGEAALAPLTGLPELRRLDLSGNAIADVSWLAGLTGLQSLDLSDNEVADLWPLAGLTGLRHLDVSGNRIEDLSALTGLPHLEVLVVDANRVTDAGALAHLGRLENLGLADNAVTDLRALAQLGSLRRLDLGGNPAEDAAPLDGLGTLVWLRLPETAAAPAGGLVRLRWLWRDDMGECLTCAEPADERRDVAR